jgi:type IV fimbrial biogenesis protein FimT
MNTKAHIRGFTLIELMMTLAVAAVILTLGVPSYQSFVRNARLIEQTNAIVVDLQFARSEALKRRQPVMLCRSADPTAGTPSCGGSANDWSSGWLVFVDANADGSYSPADDTLLRAKSVTLDTVKIKANSTADGSMGIAYRYNGRLNIPVGATARFTVCDDRNADADFDEAYGRELSLTRVGNLKVVRGSVEEPIANCDSPV